VTNANPSSNGTNVVPKLSNQGYDVLKFVAQILLPALGTLYFAIAGLWHLPSVTEVVGTITAIDVFLGVLLGLSSKTYNKAAADGELPTDGTLHASEVEGEGLVLGLDVSTPPDELVNRKTVTLKVSGPN
jgi:hypothetical protein